MSKDTVLFYHDACPDGFGSAYAFWRKFGDSLDYQPLSHVGRNNLNLEDYKGKRVFMADISLERKPLFILNDLAAELVVLDHHKTAEAAIGDLEFCKFDMSRSGAVMSWDYLFGTPAPKLLNFIQDRDLWEWKLSKTDEVLLYADSMERTFESWRELEAEFDNPKSFEAVLEKGEAIRQYRDSVVRNMISNSHNLKIKGYNVPAINTPFFRSEIVNELARESGVAFGAGYHFDGKHFTFSLRSTSSNPSNIDVSEVASMFEGGGGHAGAAGFSIKSLDDLK